MSEKTPANTEQAQDEADPVSFEQAIDQLEQLIEKIESGEVGLEQALKHYEQGTQLIKRCRSILDSAEKRIAELTETEGGGLEMSGESTDVGDEAENDADDPPADDR